jgi:hypothetical protein
LRIDFHRLAHLEILRPVSESGWRIPASDRASLSLTLVIEQGVREAIAPDLLFFHRYDRGSCGGVRQHVAFLFPLVEVNGITKETEKYDDWSKQDTEHFKRRRVRWQPRRTLPANTSC